MNYSLNKKELLSLWKKILNECERYRIKKGNQSDLYLNPIINDIYIRESAFAAKILATNFKLTKDKNFKKKAIKTISKVNKILISSQDNGLEEPFIYPKKVIFKKGSIPGTIITKHAIDEAQKILKIDHPKSTKNIYKFIKNCYLGNGYFAHNSLSTYQTKAPSIINTSAMAINYIYSSPKNDYFDKNEMNLIIKRILNSQRSDGLWPYCHQGKIDKLIFECRKFLPKKLIFVYSKIKGDSSIFFGDYLHHIVTLYYLSCFLPEVDELQYEAISKSIKRGLLFIKNNSYFFNNQLCLKFGWEPPIKAIRHCNFYDNSSYFYLLGACLKAKKYLTDLSSFFPDPTFIYNFIANNLIDEKEFKIKSHSPYNEDIKFIMNRPAESIFDKAFFFSFLIDNVFFESNY